MRHEVIHALHLPCPGILTNLTTSTEKWIWKNIAQKWHNFCSSTATTHKSYSPHCSHSYIYHWFVSVGTYFREDPQRMKDRYLAHGKRRSTSPKSPCIAHHTHCAISIITQCGFIIIKIYKWPYYMRTKSHIAPSFKWTKANSSRKRKNRAKIDLVTLISYCLGENTVILQYWLLNVTL